MKKIIKKSGWILGLATLSLAFTGCQTFPACQVNSEEEYHAPTPYAQSSPAPRADLVYQDNLIEVRKEYLSGTVVNEPYNYRLYVTAKRDLGAVEIEEWLGDNVSFVSATPQAELDGNKASWSFPYMDEGETQQIDLTVSPQQEGTFNVCSVVTEVNPRLCLPLTAGLPKLEIDKSGPATAELGQTVTWDVIVKNTGSAVAENVVVRDSIPPGFSATSPVSRDVGSLAPGESKSVQFSATADQEGSYENVALAAFKGASTEVKDSAPIEIVQSKVDITKTGPSSEYVFTEANYTVTVTNSGRTVLQDIRVTDRLPNSGKVMNPGTGKVSGNTITWMIPTLAQGQSASFDYMMTATSPGNTTNTAGVVTARGLSEEASVSTEWLAAPGVQINIIDDKDPIRVGQKTTYTIKVTNQGDFEPVGADVKVTLSDNLRPIDTSGVARGIIEGNIVTFPRAVIEANQDLVLRIVAEAIQAGPGSARLEFFTEFLNEPAISDEPTNVY